MADSSLPPHLHNRQLFSEVYLREWRAKLSDFDTLRAARQTIGEWRLEYHDLSDAAALGAYVRQTLSALDVAYAPRAEKDGFTIFADAAKSCATGLCLLIDDDDLGRAVKGRHHQAILVKKLRAAGLKWGLLTNGARWRLCCAKAAAPYEVWLETDLDGLLQPNTQTLTLEEFAVFHRFCGGAAWSLNHAASTCTPENSAASTCSVTIGLDEWAGEAEKRTLAIERHLKSRVESVLQRLCLGFVAYEEEGDYSREQLDEIYRNAIYLLYRILFLFYAEARDLLPRENAAYRPQSLQALVERAAQRQTQGAR